MVHPISFQNAFPISFFVNAIKDIFKKFDLLLNRKLGFAESNCSGYEVKREADEGRDISNEIDQEMQKDKDKKLFNWENESEKLIEEQKQISSVDETVDPSILSLQNFKEIIK